MEKKQERMKLIGIKEKSCITGIVKLNKIK